MSQSLLKKALSQFASTRDCSGDDLLAPKFEQVGRYNVRYFRQPKPGAPTLVLLNGFPQSIRMWESAIPALTEHFDLLAFDIPGFGLSKAPLEAMSPDMLSDAVLSVLDHFDIKQAHLVGPDVGVPITLAAAIKQPKRFVSLNIFDGPGTYPPKLSPVLMMVIKSRFVRWLAQGINRKAIMKLNFMTAVNEGYHQYQPDTRAIEEYYRITHDIDAHRRSVAFFGSYSQQLPWIDQRLDTISAPTLITWGKLDPFVLVDNAELLAERIPTTEVVIFENASHFSSEDAGAAYVEQLIHWVQKHSINQEAA